MSKFILIRATVPTPELGQAIADDLVSRRLAASVHVKGPTEATYRWQGEVHHRREWDCEVRTLKRLRRPVEERIRELHPYEVAEVFVTAIDVGDPELRAWLESSVDGGSS